LLTLPFFLFSEPISTPSSGKGEGNRSSGNKKVEKRIWVKFGFDTLEGHFSVSSNLKIQFPSLYSVNRKEGTEKGSTSTSAPLQREKKNSSPLSSSSSPQSQNFSAKLGTFFLKYKGGLAGGFKNQIEMGRTAEEYNLSFTSRFDLYILKFKENTYWRNDIDIKGERNALFYNWHIYSGWYPFNRQWEGGTSLTFHDRNFTQLNSGLSLQYETDTSEVEYRLFLYRQFDRKYLKKVGGYIASYPNRHPLFYTYKLYITFQRSFFHNRLTFTLTPYLLYSKEYNFTPKPELAISCKFLF